ncbi:hypothetical protein BDP67DRAFT_601228 [Colletotrichum lupini]|nr:hypothetical protein BDP67DRAFT_601228 [Colletotrichum lupini]
MAYGTRRREEEGGQFPGPAGPPVAVARTKAARSCTLNGRNTYDPSAPEAEPHPPFFAGQNIVRDATHCAGQSTAGDATAAGTGVVIEIPRHIVTRIVSSFQTSDNVLKGSRRSAVQAEKRTIWPEKAGRETSSHPPLPSPCKSTPQLQLPFSVSTAWLSPFDGSGRVLSWAIDANPAIWFDMSVGEYAGLFTSLHFTSLHFTTSPSRFQVWEFIVFELEEV